MIKVNPPKAPRPLVKKIQQPVPMQQTNAPMSTISSKSQDPEPMKTSSVQIPDAEPVVRNTTKVQELGTRFIITFFFHF